MEHKDLNETNPNKMNSSSQLQPSTVRVTQPTPPFYWNPNADPAITQPYCNFMPLAYCYLPTGNGTWMPVAAQLPVPQLHQPGLQQLRPQMLFPPPFGTPMPHLMIANGQNLIASPIGAAYPSVISEIQAPAPWQGPPPPPQSDGVSSSTEKASANSAGVFTDNVTYTATISPPASPAKMDVHLSMCDNLVLEPSSTETSTGLSPAPSTSPSPALLNTDVHLRDEQVSESSLSADRSFVISDGIAADNLTHTKASPPIAASPSNADVHPWYEHVSESASPADAAQQMQINRPLEISSAAKASPSPSAPKANVDPSDEQVSESTETSFAVSAGIASDSLTHTTTASSPVSPSKVYAFSSDKQVSSAQTSPEVSAEARAWPSSPLSNTDKHPSTSNSDDFTANASSTPATRFFVRALAPPTAPMMSTPAATRKRKLLKCKCGKKFRRASRLKKHTSVCKGKKPLFLCAHCNRGFFRRTALCSHLKSHGNSHPSGCESPNPVPTSSAAVHSLTDSTPVAKKGKIQKRKYIKCKCMNCSSDGVSVPRFSNGNLKHLCAECGSEFNRPYLLEEHAKLCKNKKSSFFCAYCERGFFSEAALGWHVKSHENSQLSGCESPNRSFEGAGTLTSAEAASPSPAQSKADVSRTVSESSSSSEKTSILVNSGIVADNAELDAQSSGKRISERPPSAETSPASSSAEKSLGMNLEYIDLTLESPSPSPPPPQVDTPSLRFALSEGYSTTEKLLAIKAEYTSIDLTRTSSSPSPPPPQVNIFLPSCDEQSIDLPRTTASRPIAYVHSYREQVSADTSCSVSTGAGANSSTPIQRETLPKTDIHLSFCNDSGNRSSSTSSTCATSLFTKERAPVPTPRGASMGDATSSPKPEIQRNRLQTCLCSNCCAPPGKQLRYRSGRLKHPCHVAHCGKAFHRPAILREHLRKCVKNFFCEHCEKRFTRKSEIRRHLRKWHTKSLTSVPDHEREELHNGTINFACEYCDEIFTRKDALFQHKQDVHHILKKPFLCRVEGCGRSYSSKGNLKTHLKLHNNIRPYVCDWPGCGKAYTFNSFLETHKQKSHYRKKK